MRRRIRQPSLRRGVCWALLSCGALLGCGEAPLPLCTVEGVVRLDGEPVPEGYLIFYPLDDGLDAEATAFQNGSFSLEVHPGKKRVEITAQRPIPGSKGMYGEPEVEQYIPVRYNRDSELTIEVKPEQANQFSFRMDSE